MAFKFNIFTGNFDYYLPGSGIAISDLSDVVISSAVDLDHLEYDGTNWVNVTDLTIKAGQKLIMDGA